MNGKTSYKIFSVNSRNREQQTRERPVLPYITYLSTSLNSSV